MTVLGTNSEDLAGRTLRAGGWRLCAGAARTMLRIGVGIGLARLMLPEAFGTFGQAMLIMGLGAVMARMGLGAAVIQRRGLEPSQAATAFSLCLASGAVVMSLLYLLAPVLGALFSNPRLPDVVRFMSPFALVGVISSVPDALLQRGLRFRTLFRVELAAFGFGYAVCGLTLAALGYGVWALAGACAAQTSLRAIAVFRASGFRPWPLFRRKDARVLLRFGAGTTLSETANFGARSGDLFMVGWRLGADALGLYSRAVQMMLAPVAELTAALSAVLFPAFSAIRTDRERIQAAFLRSVALTSAVSLPLLAGMFVLAEDIVLALLGPHWSLAVGPMRILCFGGMLRSVYSLCDTLLKSSGAVYRQAACHAVFLISILVFSLLGARFGTSGVAVAVVLSMAVVYVLLSQTALQVLGLGWRQHLAAQAPALLLGAATAGLALGCRTGLQALGACHMFIVIVTIAVCACAGLSALLLAARGHLGRPLAYSAALLVERLRCVLPGRTRPAVDLPAAGTGTRCRA